MNWEDHRDDLYTRVLRRGRTLKWRRRGLAATTIALVLAVSASAYAATRPNDETRVVTPPPGATTSTTTAVPAAGAVLMIGDSVMLGAGPALEAAIPGAIVDARVSRRFGDAVAIVDAAKSAGSLPPTIVVGLGTNSRITNDQVTSLMKAIGSTPRVFFLTVKVPRAWEFDVNATLYASVTQWSNTSVLDWHDYAQSHDDWFVSDGFHLTAAGKLAYAALVAGAVRSTAPPHGADPSTFKALPATGIAVLSDHKAGGAPGTQGSFAITLFDDNGRRIGALPQGGVGTDVLNNPQDLGLTATFADVQFVLLPLKPAIDAGIECNITGTVPSVEVALCGPGVRPQILGTRIMVKRGSTWSELIAKPPVSPGTTVAGHWNWASASPDGKWVVADWSAECEVVRSLFISVADGSVHAVTGEQGTAWGSAPPSGSLGWHADGSVIAVFGGESGCGASGPVPRGVYAVSLDSGARRLLVPLGADDGVLRWQRFDYLGVP